MSRVRSPLRFPGGKSLAVKIIAPMVPSEHKVIVSPFMGGGSLELHWAQNGRRVIAYDGFKPLVSFWCYILGQIPHGLSTFLCALDNYIRIYPVTKQGFYEIQNHFRETLGLEEFGLCCAVEFFILNRASFSGTTMSGGCSDPSARFTQSSIDRLREFADFKGKLAVSYSLWPDTLAKHPDKFLYLDPPYMIGPKIYGVRGDMHKDFDHKGLAAALRARTTPWLLSYNDCDEIRALYEGFDIQQAQWSNSMSSKKKRQQELIIKNY